MKGNSNLKDLMGKISMYIDGELGKEEERDLLLEIKQNPQYMQILGKEKNFREFVKTRLQRKTVSPNLVQSIKDQIRANSSAGSAEG